MVTSTAHADTQSTALEEAHDPTEGTTPDAVHADTEGTVDEALTPRARVVCVTQGQLTPSSDGVAIEQPALRFFVPDSGGDRATLSFTYLGPSDATRTLKSGAIREQLGVKLRARDGCNVLYAMWRISESRIVVQLKSNPEASTSDVCGVAGYATVRPQLEVALPAITEGSRHELEASLNGRVLRVSIDALEVWSGLVPEHMVLAEGPVGFRTDNVKLLVHGMRVQGAAQDALCPAGKPLALDARIFDAR
jgi:hypothetical protein